MNEHEEENFHLYQCERCLQEALAIIEVILEEQDKTKGNSSKNIKKLISAAFQFSLIEYSKPFNRSKGEHHTPKHHKLMADEYIHPDDMELHNEIIRTRNQELAHHDLTVFSAKCIDGQYLINIKSPIELIGQIDLIKKLIERIIDNIHKKSPPFSV
jgi:hypothetical protein